MNSLITLSLVWGVAFSMKAPLTLEQLTDRVPVVVIGSVVDRSNGSFATHPNLKEVLSPGEKAMVEGGFGYIEWSVAVTRTEKGDAKGEVRVLRGVNGRGERYSVAIIGTEFPDLTVGTCYRLWLEPGEAYLTDPHYILVEAYEEQACGE